MNVNYRFHLCVDGFPMLGAYNIEYILNYLYRGDNWEKEHLPTMTREQVREMIFSIGKVRIGYRYSTETDATGL